MSSKTSFIDSVSSLIGYTDEFVEFDDRQNILPTTVGVDETITFEFGSWCEFLKRLSPDSGKVVMVKEVELNISAMRNAGSGVNTDVKIFKCSVYLVRRTNLPEQDLLDNLGSMVKIGAVVPLRHGVFFQSSCEFQQSDGDGSTVYSQPTSNMVIPVSQYVLQPCKLLVVVDLITSATQGFSDVDSGYLVLVSGVMRYKVESKTVNFIRKLMDAYSSFAGGIEKRGQ